MQFKKHAAIILSILILFSNLGLALNMRLCNNKNGLLNDSYKIAKNCASVASCCTTLKIHKKCCSNKVVKLDNKTEKILTKLVQLDLEKNIIVTVLETKFKLDSNTAKRNKITSFYYNSNAPPFYKLYCQYIFYA